MLADVMELNISQNYSTGEIVREWVPSETINCRAKTIITDTGSKRDAGTNFASSFKESQHIKLKSSNKISSRKKLTNIRDVNTNVVLFTENKIDESPTIYDVVSSEPVFDPFGRIIFYDTLLYRSDIQDGN